MRFLCVSLVSLACLAACSTGSEQVTVKRDGSRAEGSAGTNWSDEDLRKNAFGAVCANPGEKVAEITIGPRDSNGVGEFSATCTK